MIFLHFAYPLFSMDKISNILDYFTLKHYPLPTRLVTSFAEGEIKVLHFFLTITQYSNCLLYEKRPDKKTNTIQS